MIAMIPAYTLLELVPGKMLHELSENSLAKVHPSLSAIDCGLPRQPASVCIPERKLKSKNSKNALNFHGSYALAGIENSCPGQQ
jgi:hypothetical protein